MRCSSSGGGASQFPGCRRQVVFHTSYSSSTWLAPSLPGCGRACAVRPPARQRQSMRRSSWGYPDSGVGLRFFTRPHSQVQGARWSVCSKEARQAFRLGPETRELKPPGELLYAGEQPAVSDRLAGERQRCIGTARGSRAAGGVSSWARAVTCPPPRRGQPRGALSAKSRRGPRARATSTPANVRAPGFTPLGQSGPASPIKPGPWALLGRFGHASLTRLHLKGQKRVETGRRPSTLVWTPPPPP